MQTATTFSEASTEVDASAPRRRIADYYQLIKPRMNLLVLGTTAVGYYMAARGPANWLHFMHTLIGTALLAAGAAVLNQHWERRHDANMNRTARRPIPAGRIGATEALILGSVFALIGVLELFIWVNPLTATLGTATFGIYVFIYTPLKRVTTLCTIVGAIPGALPTVMGWTAVNGKLPAPILYAMLPQAMALFGILFFWQLPHFLAIAILYKDDYAKAGFKMLPVVDKNLRDKLADHCLVAGIDSRNVTAEHLAPGAVCAADDRDDVFLCRLSDGPSLRGIRRDLCDQARKSRGKAIVFLLDHLPAAADNMHDFGQSEFLNTPSLQGKCVSPLTPSPGTPGEGWGGGRLSVRSKNPHPNPPPEYRERERAQRRLPPVRTRTEQIFAVLLFAAIIVGCDKSDIKSAAVDQTAPPPATIGHPGTITGRVVLSGKAPELPRLSVLGDPHCQQLHPDGLPDETVVVAVDGAVANVFVYLKDAPRSDGSTRDPAIIDQVGCQYQPHVVAVQINQPLRVKSSDSVFHNVHILATSNPAQNLSETGPGEQVVKFAQPEMIHVRCDVHPWMKAIIGVFDNPCFAVTTPDGKFEIHNVPPGTYTLATWHERIGELTKKITVEPDETVHSDFTYVP